MHLQYIRIFVCFLNYNLSFSTLQCIDYRNGMAFGNLCKPLCDEGKVRVISCVPMHKGMFIAILLFFSAS